MGVVGDRAHEPWFRDSMPPSLQSRDERGCDTRWLTHWPSVDIAQTFVIGGITFTGPPNQGGEVEIGDGIAEALHNNGSMTECIHGVVQWSFQHDGVAAVTVETAKQNLASEVVLRNNRCMYVRDTEEFRY